MYGFLRVVIRPSMGIMALRHTLTFKTAVETAEKLVLPSSRASFNDPFLLVSHEMSNLAKSIASMIGSGHPTLNRVSSYYFEAEGKNVRPLIVLLLSKALLKIPVEQRNRTAIDDLDVVDQQPFKGTPTSHTVVAGKSVDDSISPLAILHGINPKVILDPLWMRCPSSMHPMGFCRNKGGLQKS